MLNIINSDFGYIRERVQFLNKEDHSFYVKACDGRLKDIRSCSSRFLTKSTLFLLIPFLSVVFGFNRLYDLFLVKHQDDTLKAKIYFAVTGIVSFLGLGVLLVALRLIVTLLLCISAALVYTAHIFCKDNPHALKIAEKLLMPFIKTYTLLASPEAMPARG